MHASRTIQQVNSSAGKIFPHMYRITKNVDRNWSLVNVEDLLKKVYVKIKWEDVHESIFIKMLFDGLTDLQTQRYICQ